VEEVDLGGGVKIAFVLIPPGKFLMGSPKEEKDRDKDEEQHEVEITRPFYLGKYEVTQEQYQRIMGKNPSSFSAVKYSPRRFPVELVSWEDAVAFCRILTNRDAKRRFRLPSEAEWEYACRAGTTTPFHFGSSLNGDKANCDGTRSPYGTAEKGQDLIQPCQVGSYAANAFGLHDMHGNVYEWCQDYYGPYKSLAKKDPLREEKIDKSGHVVRGGSWGNPARHCRAAVRSWGELGVRKGNVGFRVATRLASLSAD
jgi:formylglycine-generating enzyme required for sulfatase activity